MQIIKKFSPQDSNLITRGLALVESQGVGLFSQKRLAYVPTGNRGVVTLPILNPTLARYTGIQTIPDVRFACYSPTQQTYLRSTGTAWEQIGLPEYQDVDLIRPVLGLWVGPLQLEIEVSEAWYGLWISYEVNADLVSYLLRYALPSRLQKEVITLSRRGYSDEDGYFSIVGIDPELIRSLEVRVMGQAFQLMNLEDGKVNIGIAHQPIEAWVHVNPQVEAAYHLYQAEKLPCCVLRSLREENVRYPQGEETIQVSATESLFVKAGYLADLPIEAKVIAVEEEDGRAIAAGLMAGLQRDGRIPLAPFDLTVAAWSTGQMQLTPGIPPSYTFRFTLKNIIGAILSEVRPTATDYKVYLPQPMQFVELTETPSAIASTGAITIS